MPPLPTPGQVVKLEFNTYCEDALATNIEYYSYSGSGAVSLAELTAFATSGTMESGHDGPWDGSMSELGGGVNNIYTDLSSDVGVTFTRENTWVGTNTGSAIPASASVVVSRKIARRYRGGHSRVYMMVGTAGDFETSSKKFWQASFLSNVQSGFDAFLAAFPLTIGSRTWNPVNVSYWETVTVGGVKTRQLRETPLVDTVIQYVAESRVCSQRRRLGKVGG